MKTETGDQTGELTEASRLDILADAGLWTNDPEQYPGLVEQMDPELGLNLSFRALRYDTSLTTKRMVPCSICVQRQPHYKGAIVQLKSNQIGLVGHDCGDRHFFGGDGWKKLQNQLTAAADAALFARRWGPARDALNEVLTRLDQWQSDLQVVREVQSRFSALFPILSSDIAQFISQGELSVDREFRETYRTAAGEEGTRTSFRKEIIFRTKASWFLLGDDLTAHLVSVGKRIGEAKGLLRVDATAQNVTFLKRFLRGVYNDLEDIERMQRELSPLGSATSLQKLAQWANRMGGMDGRFSNQGSLFLAKPKKGEPIQIDFAMPVAQLSQHWEAVKQAWPSL